MLVIEINMFIMPEERSQKGEIFEDTENRKKNL